MKKLIIMAAILVAGVAANAASFKWSAGNIYASNGTDKYTGDVMLYATGIDGVLSTVTASSSGAVAATSFESSAFTSGTTYDFYFVIEDNGKQFTSTAKSVQALDVGTASITFGNMASATQNPANWVGGAVPEPTSGLLMLLGMAGLALRRRRA